MKTKIYIHLLLMSVMYVTGANHPIKEKASTTKTLKFMNFNAVKHGNNVKIFWSIKPETNCSLFILERSKNGVNFEKVSKINVTNNSGNEISYIETDYNPLKEISFYRLRIINSNNSTVFSPIVMVNFLYNKNIQNVFSNTKNIDLITEFEKTKTLVVLRDLNGVEYYSKLSIYIENYDIIGVDTEKKLPSGTYVITASSNNLLYSQKLIIR